MCHPHLQSVSVGHCTDGDEESLLIASQVSQASASTSAANSSQPEDATYIPDSDEDSEADTGENWVCITASD